MNITKQWWKTLSRIVTPIILGIAPLAAAGIAAIGQAGLGLLENDRKYGQQKRLMDKALQQSKELGAYNQGLALDMWNKTNFEATRKHMEKAGLNVGLMYGGTGAGGGTTSTPTGSVSAPSAPDTRLGDIGMAMQVGLQTQQQKAEIEVLKAQKDNIEADTNKKKGADTDKTETETRVLKHEEEIRRVAAEVQGKSAEEQIKAIKIANEKAQAQLQAERAEGVIKEATVDDVIKQIKTATTEQELRIKALEAGIDKTKIETEGGKAMLKEIATKIELMGNEQAAMWIKLDQADKERWVKEAQLELNRKGTEFDTGSSAETKRWTEIISTVIGAGAGAAKAMK